mgnify:CR=1 FL=1
MEPPAPAAVDPRPQVWPAFVGFGAALFAIQILGVLVLGVLFAIHWIGAGEKPDTAEEILHAIEAFVFSPTTVVASAAVSSLTLTGAALIGARLAKTPARVRLRLGPSHWSWGRVVIAAFGALALSQVCSQVISLAGLDGIGVLKLFANAFTTMSPVMVVLAFLFIGITAPIGEEMFFRGFMQTRLAGRWSRALSIGVTAGAFGFMHMDPVQGPFALIVGLYLGWITESSGSIRPAIAAHALNNCFSVVGSRFGPQEVSRTVDLAIIGGASVTLAGALAVLLLLKPKPALAV